MENSIYQNIFFVKLLLLINSDFEEMWICNATDGNPKEMREIYQELKNKGWQRKLKNWKDSLGLAALIGAIQYGHHHDIYQWLVRENLVEVISKNISCNYTPIL